MPGTVAFRNRVRDAAFPLLLAALPAHGGRPFTTEDAAIVEAKGCQVEAWVDRENDATTAWVVPACNFGLDTEWQAGFARTRENGEARFSEQYVQAKTLLRAMTDDEPWGVSIVAGVIRRPYNTTHRGWHNPYVLVPFTQRICNTPLAFHGNVGWLREREAGRNLTLWGAAIEAAASRRLTLLAEAHGQNSDRPWVRVGVRWSAIPDRLELDLSWATRPGRAGEERLVSVGVSWQSGAFLP